MDCEFEEKGFEVPLFHQLLGKSRNYFIPGQVLEHYLGFDLAMRTAHAGFWTLWSVAPPPGAAVSQSWFSQPGTVHSLPPFRLNLFVQCKRPDAMIHGNAGEWSHWGRPYFRFSKMPHQQAALARLARKLGCAGMVVYASPTFYEMTELFRHTSKNDLVQNTNFAPARRLARHHRYTYVSPGKKGKAFSDPTDIEPVNLLDPMHVLDTAASDEALGREFGEHPLSVEEDGGHTPRRSDRRADGDPPRGRPPSAMAAGGDNGNWRRSFRQTVKVAAESVDATVTSADYPWQEQFSDLLAAVADSIPSTDDDLTAHRFARVTVFCWTLGTHWLLLGK